MPPPLSAFISQYVGASGVGDTPENRGQCVGLVEAWLDANGQPHVWGNACDLLANAPRPPYRAVANGPANFPPPGAIVCWGTAWGAGYGHAALVLAANATHLVVFEQNDPQGAGCLVNTHGYNGIIGWLLLPGTVA